ncbi:MAG TPA: rod shape-determining protein MreC [Vicinamibacterales bacterium]
MALLETRRGSTVLLVAVIVGHIVLISAQVTSKSGMPVLQAVAFGLVAEVQRLGAAAFDAVASVWTGYVDLRGLREENAQLRQELADARIRLQQERALAQRSEELARLLELRSRIDLATTAANVVAAAATPDFRTITIDKGTAAGLRPDMAVLSPEGVVGRVVVPGARASKVQLLIDRNAAVGALVERSRAQGVVVGIGEQTLRLEFVLDTADVTVGDRVVSSGIDGIYPKGFLIGQVDHIERAGNAYRLIRVQPAVDFTRLEEVLVVLTPQTPEPPGDPSTAAGRGGSR